MIRVFIVAIIASLIILLLALLKRKADPGKRPVVSDVQRLTYEIAKDFLSSLDLILGPVKTNNEITQRVILKGVRYLFQKKLDPDKLDNREAQKLIRTAKEKMLQAYSKVLKMGAPQTLPYLRQLEEDLTASEQSLDTDANERLIAVCRRVIKISDGILEADDFKDENPEPADGPSQSSKPIINHYEVLGIPRNADADLVKNVYRKLCQIYHPDANVIADTQAATLQFEKIKDAYDVLSDPKRKAEFDQTLGGA